MPSFKPKNDKKFLQVPSASHCTLDKNHMDLVNSFKFNTNDVIPKLRLSVIKYSELLKSKQYKNLEEKYELEESRKSCELKIKELEDNEINYYLDNSKYIFEYFENKKKLSCTDVDVTNSDGSNHSTATMKLLNSFFKINNNSEDGLDDVGEKGFNDDIMSKNTIFQNYLKNVDGVRMDQSMFYIKKNTCKYCKKGEMISMEDEGILLCNICCVVSKYLIENEKPSYKEPPKEVCFYAYKKINHFKEILAQFQGKESTNIPLTVMESIKQQIKKERLDVKHISYEELKALLKKLGLNKYYEHINFIKHKLGIQPITISQETEEALCNLFVEIQQPYAKHCPDYRVNFLHYFFVLYKLFQLIGETKYLSEIPMLKDKDKLIEQDVIWKKICNELNWEFIPTL